MNKRSIINKKVLLDETGETMPQIDDQTAK